MQLALNFGGETINAPDGIPAGGLMNLQDIFSNAIIIFIIIGMFLLVIYIVWAGIQWITSGGDKAKLTAARGRLTWAIIGLVVIFSSFFIINAIGYLFKVNLLTLF